jgi:hypothetical protein
MRPRKCPPVGAAEAANQRTSVGNRKPRAQINLAHMTTVCIRGFRRSYRGNIEPRAQINAANPAPKSTPRS